MGKKHSQKKIRYFFFLTEKMTENFENQKTGKIQRRKIEEEKNR